MEQLLTLAEAWADRPHLIQGGRTVDFAGLRRGAGAKARVLAEAGVKPGDRVVLLGWNSPDFVMNFWACVEAGAVPALANAWWGETEIRDALELVTLALVLADGRTRPKVPQAWPCGPWDADEGAAGIPGAVPDVNAAPSGENETVVVVFTSGTEGRAKGVALSHRALLSGLQMMLDITRLLPPRFDAAKSEIALHTGPQFHVGGPQVMLRSVAVGNTLASPAGRFDPADVLQSIEAHRINRWTAVPTMITRVQDHPDARTRDLDSLRAIGMGALR